MSDGIEIVRDLPYLRRYARALTGSQGSGDQYVRLCLEAVIADRSLIDPARAPRAALYAAFHRVAAHVSPLGDAPAAGGGGLAGRVATLPRHERQVLLLTSIEGFTLADAADILGIDVAEAAARLETARAAMRRQPPTRVLIVEDESVIALNLSDIVAEAGHEIVGVAATEREAVEMARREKPGLVLADIQLRDGSSGLDAVRRILAEMVVPVIFITAFPERLLTGERPEPTFLVTKPFDAGTVTVTMSQALLADVAVPRRAAG